MKKSKNNISNWLKKHCDPKIDRLAEDEIIKVMTKENKIKLLESFNFSDLDEHVLGEIIKQLWR
jgi:hypothetical protein